MAAFCAQNVLAEGEQPIKHHYLLSINLAPAACILHPERRELRQCQEGYSIIVHGLWTEKTKSSPDKVQEICSEKPPELSPVQQRVLEKLMPDEDARNKAWQKYGACMGLSAQDYFRTITAYTNKLKLPETFKEEGSDRLVERDELLAQILKLNAGLTDKGVYLRCQSNQEKTFLTEVRVCYDKLGQFIDCKNFKPNCPETMTLRKVK
jgi:ribonuclease T2